MCASAEVRVKAVEVKVETAAEGLAETLIAMIEGRSVAGFGRSGRAGVPPPAADGDGTPSLECNGCCE